MPKILIALVIFVSLRPANCQFPPYLPFCGRFSHDVNKVKLNISHQYFVASDNLDTDPANPNLDINVEISWIIDYVPEDLQIDGFLIYFAKSPGIDPSQNPIISDNSCNSGNDNVWLSTANETTCNNYNESFGLENCKSSDCICDRADCQLLDESTCRGLKYYMEYLSKNSFTLPFSARKVTFQAQFGTTYNFKIFPYAREIYPVNQRSFQWQLESVNCVDVLEQKNSLTQDDVYEICCRLQGKDNQVRDFKILSPVPDFETGTFNATIKLTRIFNNKTILYFNLSPTDNIYDYQPRVDENNAMVESLPELNYSLSNLRSGETCLTERTQSVFSVYFLKKNTEYRLTIQQNCADDDCYTVELFHLPKVNTCDEEWGYCSSNASCSFSSDKLSNTTCECSYGFEGDGLNSGSQCVDIDSCIDAKDGNCSDNSICTDYKAPLNGFECSCKRGYYGDGYIDGSGCRSVLVISLAIALPLLALIIIVVAILAWKLRVRREWKRDSMLSKFIVDIDNGILNSYNEDCEKHDGPWEATFGDKWEIDRKAIDVGEVIGRGNYGIVHKATMNPFVSTDKTNNSQLVYENEYARKEKGNIYVEIKPNIDVAVKSLQDNHLSHANLAEFLAEIGVLINVGKHKNIVNIYGCCTTEKPVLLVTEYMKYGNLLHFLWDAREPTKAAEDPVYKVTESSLSRMAQGIASGMEQLSRIRIIHGDLAARNILVGEEGICKISDFGLANDAYRYGSIKGQVERSVPFKWISPERMMEGKVPVTHKSDVWSFGILLYEMFTLGCAPHADIPSEKLLEKLTDGYRMPQPKSCSNEIYDLMQKCWKWRPSSRPSFTQIFKTLEAIADKTNDSYYLAATHMEHVDKDGYLVEFNKMKTNRVNSTDEGFVESGHSNATGDVSDVTSESTDSGNEEGLKVNSVDVNL